MILMKSWIAAQGSGLVVLRALPMLLATVLQAQFALCFEGSLVIMPSEPTSTLGGHVSQQDLDLQKTVIDFVHSGILAGKKQPAAAPKQVQAEPKTASSPELQLAQPLSQPKPASQSSEDIATEDIATEDIASEDKATKLSPFRKWVKPQTSAASDTAAEPKSISEGPQLQVAPAPQVARRLRRATSSRQPKPLPKSTKKPQLTKKHSTAVASDLSKNNEETSKNDNHQNQTLAEPPKAEVKTYPEPESEATASPVKNLPPLTKSQVNLRKKIRNVLTHYYSRPLNTRDRSPWELMHAMLAFEAHSKVLKGGPNGEPITAVGWLCYNQACKRRTLMYVNDDGEIRVRVGPALQGHRGQLLAMLAQSRINVNYPMLVEDHELKVADLIEMEKRTCYPRTELTFKLIGLMHYLDSDETWLNDQGMEWGIPRLISEELRQPVRGAACGGTHRLSGLTLAYKTREARGEPVDGEYLKAKKFVTRYQQYAYRLQNRDGSFSTEWFRGPGNEESLDRKLKTTGHILEWLLYAANEKELKHWRTTKAANYLANIMYRNRYKDWEAGPLGHAIHALLVYDRLVFSPYDPPNHSPLAFKPSTVR